MMGWIGTARSPMAAGISAVAILLASIYLSTARTQTAALRQSYAEVGSMKRIATHLGDVQVRLIGKASKGTVVCLSGINPDLSDEWVPVGSRLAEIGYQVAIIDFHSNEKTKPKMLWGGVSDEDVEKIIRIYLIGGLGVRSVTLMGKSWGGRQASLFTAMNPQLVSRLCLVCPASSDKALVNGVARAGIPVLMAWARDDYVKWYSNTATWRSALGASLELHTAEKGGHLILPEYIEPISRFVAADSN